MRSSFAVVDLFAGPGGLGEGFSSVKAPDGSRPFKIAISVEMDPAAHATLRLRSFVRQFRDGGPQEYFDFLNYGGPEPNWSSIYPDEWQAAEMEAMHLTLGTPEAEGILNPRLNEVRNQYANGDRVVVIGGPPCQAYSLVGRARNRGVAGYNPEADHRHFLYKEYIRILKSVRPAIFVMENVKGILSSSIKGDRIFEKILKDLRLSGGNDPYHLVALAPPEDGKPSQTPKIHEPNDFVIQSENYGVPQARHRVIVVGIRESILKTKNCIASLSHELHLPKRPRACVTHVLDGMPRLRSGLSRSDSPEAWKKAFRASAKQLLSLSNQVRHVDTVAFRKRINSCIENADELSTLPRSASTPNGVAEDCPKDLRAWLKNPKLCALPNNETRGHMPSDITRYLFASTYADLTGISPKAHVYPEALAPEHQSWKSGKFSDRFRVQVRSNPSTTITSHIAKDGHYFIHPDPAQCRSLTVREAARLQTFPDDYFFKGNRTQQFTQVGNAVPPYLAKQIADVIFEILKPLQEHAHEYPKVLRPITASS